MDHIKRPYRNALVLLPIFEFSIGNNGIPGIEYDIQIELDLFVHVIKTGKQDQSVTIWSFDMIQP
ncbi:MAG: hypothetical protein AAFQ20_16085, partial [Bacteroidota bacterium]